MRLSPSSTPAPQFGGYFAAPLKALHCQAVAEKDQRDINADLQKQTRDVGVNTHLHGKAGLLDTLKSLPEGFQQQAFYSPWTQDDLWFLNRDGKTVIARPGLYEPNEGANAEILARHLGLPLEELRSAVVGGNCFIGQRPDKSRFALMGHDALKFTALQLAAHDLGHYLPNSFKVMNAQWDLPAQFRQFEARYEAEQESYDARAREIIADDLGMKVEDLQFISQPEFHIDMMVRPLAYPKVLVQDFRLGQAMLEQAIEQEPDPATREHLHTYAERTRQYENDLPISANGPFCTVDKTAEELKELGYEVIRVPGLLHTTGQSVNFMNAIVHQQPDGKLAYITNAAPSRILNELFEATLKGSCPEIASVHFVSGVSGPSNANQISRQLARLEGGVHCMSAERPDFEAWA